MTIKEQIEKAKTDLGYFLKTFCKIKTKDGELIDIYSELNESFKHGAEQIRKEEEDERILNDLENIINKLMRRELTELEKNVLSGNYEEEQAWDALYDLIDEHGDDEQEMIWEVITTINKYFNPDRGEAQVPRLTPIYCFDPEGWHKALGDEQFTNMLTCGKEIVTTVKGDKYIRKFVEEHDL